MSSDTGVTSDFVLDLAGQRLARREGTVWRDYVFLGGQMLAYFDDGADEPIQVVSDHIGMPMLAIDSSGDVVWDALAEPYGELSGSANQPFDPGLRYPGQWQDDLDLEATCDGDNCIFPGPLDGSVSLFENGYRWYRPAWGRYTQADPIGLNGGMNLYSYSRTNPRRWTDPSGLKCEGCCTLDWYREREFENIKISVGNALLRHQAGILLGRKEARCEEWQLTVGAGIRSAKPECHSSRFIESGETRGLPANHLGFDYWLPFVGWVEGRRGLSWPVHVANVLKPCNVDRWEQGYILDAWPHGNLKVTTWGDWSHTPVFQGIATRGKPGSSCSFD